MQKRKQFVVLIHLILAIFMTHFQFQPIVELIAFGGLLMLISPSLHKREKMTSLSVLACIPLLTCALVGSVLHGTAYTHFLSIQQNRLFLQDHSYVCSDITKDSPQCQCTKINRLQGTSDNILLTVPCAQQKSLVGFHGALLTFSAMAFALLLGVLVICVIFLLHFFKLQVPINTTTSGQDNEGFSHARGRRHSIGVHVDPPISQHPSQTTLNTPLDHPPSYESLMTSLDMTSFGMTSRDNTSHGTIVTYDVTDERNMAATVNRQARVRYRGQLSSTLINQIPGRENSPNEVSNSVELANAESQMAVNDGAAVPQNSNSIPQGEPIHLRTSRDRQVSDEQNGTTRSDNREVTSSTTRRDIEARRQQTTSNNINDPRHDSEPSIETRSGGNVRNTHLFFEPSDEMVPHGENNSSGQSSNITNANPSTEQSSEINRRVLRNSSLRNPQTSSIDHSSNMPVTYEGGNSTGRNITNPLSPSMEHTGEMISHERSITNPSIDHSSEMVSHDSRLTVHAQLEPTVSNNSEDGVYIDITQSLAHSSGVVHSDDSTHIAARYRGQAINSIQTRSLITHEQDDIADENEVNINLQERTTEEVPDSSNAINSLQSSTEQTTDSLNNDTADAASIVTENLTGEDDIHNEIPPERVSQSISSESNDIYPHNADANSVSSLEVMSI